MALLYVSDLDGTFIQRDERLSPYARAELIRLLAEGLPITFASARSVASIRPIFEGVPLRLPVIEFNGTMASWIESGEREFCHVIESDAARAAAEAGMRIGTTPFVSTGAPNASGDALYVPSARNEGMEQYFANRVGAGDYRLRPGAAIEEGLARSVTCLTFVDRQDRLAPLERLFADRFPGTFYMSFYENWYSPGWWWLTLHPALGTKANAVARIAARVGADMNDVTVFGDQVNDIPMFEAAGHAVAVENAVPELIVHADEVIAPNTSDSVVRWLAEHWRPGI